MKRVGGEAGIVAMLLAVARTHVLELALVLLGAISLGVGLTAFNEPTHTYDFLRDYLGGSAEEGADDVFLSALLEMEDGEWRVREHQGLAVPVGDGASIFVRHESAVGRLVGDAPPFWVVGAGRRRLRVPRWSITSRYRLAPEGPGPAVATWQIVVEVDEERRGGYPVVADAGSVAIGSDGAVVHRGVERRIMVAPEGGSLLHLIALAPREAGDPRNVETWRRLVRAAALDVAAEGDGSERDQLVPERHPHLVTVATLLGVDDALATLAVRPFRGPAGDGVSSAQIEELADRFARPAQIVTWLRDTHRDDPPLASAAQELLESTYAWDDMAPLAPPGSSGHPFLVPLAALSLLAVFPAGSATALRRRDVAALLAALILASSALPLVEHVTTQTFGLMSAALQLGRLRRRRAIALPLGVPRALALAALLLPLASVTRLPTLDAIGGALAFAVVAWLALALPLRRHPRGGAPRAAGGKRPFSWASIQVIGVVLAVIALVAATLDPWQWPADPPHPRWSLISVGIVLATAAGIAAYLRGQAPRPQPAAACAAAVGAAIHLTLIGLSPLPLDRLSGERALAVVCLVATAILLVFASQRLFASASSA